MSPETALIIAVASGVFALLGSLGSQIINTRATLKTKRMELVYDRKLEAYTNFLEKAVTLAQEIGSEDKYLDLQRAFLTVATVASQDVYDVIAETKTGVVHLGRKAHTLNMKSDASGKQSHQSYMEAVEALARAIRNDLREFSGMK